MSANEGVLVIAAIRPNDSLDTFPTAYANELLGGWKQVQSIADRDAIPTLRLEAGTVCFVDDDQTLYMWDGAAWVVYQSGGGGIVLTGTLAVGSNTLDSLAIATYADAYWLFLLQKTTTRYSGAIRANHNGTTAEWTETSDVFAPPAGTFDVTTGVDISGGNLRFLVTAATTGWVYRVRRFSLDV